MSSEKLRRETNRFDITFLRNTESNAYVLEKPLPKGLKAEDFLGHICTVKIRDGEYSSYQKRYYYDFDAGFITDVMATKYVDATNNSIGVDSVDVYVVFRSFTVNRSHLVLKFTYFPDRDNTTSAIRSLYSYNDYQPSDAVAYDTIVLNKTIDSSTGDATYSGSGYVHGFGTYPDAVHSAFITLQSAEKVGSRPKYSSISKISDYVTEYTASNQSTSSLHLTRYLKWLPSEVKNVSITIDVMNSTDTTSSYLGVKKYPITVTFTVPAANL